MKSAAKEQARLARILSGESGKKTETTGKEPVSVEELMAAADAILARLGQQLASTFIVEVSSDILREMISRQSETWTKPCAFVQRKCSLTSSSFLDTSSKKGDYSYAFACIPKLANS